MQDSIKKQNKTKTYYLSSNTLWTLPSASCFTMLAFLFILHIPPLSGVDVVIFYLKKLNSLHRRAAKLMVPDPFTTTEAKIQRLGLLPLSEKLTFNKALLVFKACRNLAPQYLTSLFVCSNSLPFSAPFFWLISVYRLFTCINFVCIANPYARFSCF